MRMLFIGLDIGSSYFKSAVLDLQAARLLDVRKDKAPLKLPTAEEGRYEIDAEAMAALASAHIGKLLNRYRGAIAGIVLSTQMHGFVLTDDSGMPVTAYISWQDRRCLERLADGEENSLEALEQLLGPHAPARSGLRLKPGLALGNLYSWLQQNREAAACRRAAEFHTLGSFLIRRLTGAHATHLTNAAATGMVDVVDRVWNARTIDEASCGNLRFPALVGETEQAGVYRSRYGNIPVYPDIGDHQASVLGCCGNGGNDIIVTLGTAGLLSRESASWSEGEDKYECRPYFEGGYLNTVSRLPGGRNFDVLIEFVQSVARDVWGRTPGKDRIWRESARLAEAAARDPIAPLRVELGFYPGQLGVDRGQIGTIDAHNLRLGPLFLGAFDNMADVYRTMLGRLCGSFGEAHRVIFAGGLAWRNPLLRQRMSVGLGLPGDLPPLADESLVGLFRLALVCGGQFRTLAETQETALALGKLTPV
ncbi:sedoheptulokinase [Paenibacillus koleovorans]|uniref:sedoheptulokinase n=1 Tax=Paenibacillus koleovorans TaxID=121608 RepID=UPI000FD7AC75|nr:FGGY family carbohydrate kinase [Paenibacillus koleovorans]